MAASSEGQLSAAGIEKTWGAVVRSPEGTPQKVRQLIDEGIVPEEGGTEPKDTSATLQSADGYKERCAELKKSLCSAHEKFCFWPDSPSPDRFGMLPLGEPAVLVSEFLDRFQSLCHLDLQLPSLRPEDLKSMCLTEDKISALLHLLEDELNYQTDDRKTTSKLGSDIHVQATACVLSLCGWACRLRKRIIISLEPTQLSLITCHQCMRKVGLWGFQQIESSVTDLEASFGLTSSPIPGVEGRPEPFPLVPESPRRMMTRSQDATVSPSSEQSEKSPGPIVSRTRSWESSSPVDRLELEAASPTTRSRPVTRSMGTGDSASLEVPSSPLRRAKRARFCSSSSSDTSPRSFFDPTSQHRDWCPWVNITLVNETRENGQPEEAACTPAEPGWKAVLTTLLAHKHCKQPAETDSMSLSEKSRKVFRIFRQWESESLSSS
ncbi:Nuclear-interacting partner of ALK [Apodemus speciosus]|uniref:Nuclear-interacting partner of ALK n=1 Tax=Apodemus speciosus TaxID=105296 RepID=A0ABQ0EV04_APOSI